MEGEESSNKDDVHMKLLPKEELQHDQFKGAHKSWVAKRSFDESGGLSDELYVGTIESEKCSDVLPTTEFNKVFCV